MQPTTTDPRDRSPGASRRSPRLPAGRAALAPLHALPALLAMLALLTAPAHAEESRWALLVGIDDYIDPGISSLSGSVNDVVAVREALVTAGRFPSGQVFLLTSDDPGNLPTRGNIRARLEHIARQADSDDLVYLHFSLHAVLDDETGEGYLLTHRTDPRYVNEEGLSVSELRERLEGLAAPKRLLVLDGCRNDPESARGDRDNRRDERFSRSLVITPRAAPAGGVSFTQTLFACSPGERAYEWPGRDRGLFSVALEEALRGEADGADGDGQVTLGELCTYVRARVPELLSVHLPDKQQRPDVSDPPAAARSYALSEAALGGGRIREADLPPVARRASTATPDLDPVFVRKAAKDPTIRLTVAPAASITPAEARALLLRWEAEVDVGVKGYRWRLDDGELQESGRAWADVSAAEPGTHTFQVQVQDRWGNWSPPARTQFEVLPNRRPEVAFGSPTAGARVQGERLAVALTGSDIDGRIVKWRLALDDPDDFRESEDGRFELPGPVDGPHTLFAQAIDDEGGTSLWQSQALRFAYAEPEPEPEPERAAAGAGSISDGAAPGRVGSRTSADAHRWSKGRPAPEVSGFTLVGTNAQGYPEYDKALPGGVSMRFVLVPAGSFSMGSLGGEEGRSNAEGPQHQVTLDAFLLAKTECTQRQWQAVMGSNPSRFTAAGPDAPVEQVSWNDIQGFEQKTGLLLPSEAQWEYAARAGTTGPRHGDLDAIAWHRGNSGNATHPVGQRQTNAFGLHDMIGNVLEWCEDTWHGSYAGAPSNGAAWVDSGSYRVIRGGYWSSYSSNCRSASRRSNVPGRTYINIGFRVVLAPVLVP